MPRQHRSTKRAYADSGEFVWTRDASAFCWHAYIGEGADSPYATAARADDLSGRPLALRKS